MSTRRILATVVASAALGLGAVSPAAAIVLPEPGPRPSTSGEIPRATDAPGTAQTPPARSATVGVDDVMAHLEAFQAIAVLHDGNRAAGTAGHEATAEYVEAQLAAVGYDTWRHSFPFTYEETRSTSLVYTVGQTTTAASHLPMAQSPGTPDGGLTGGVVAPGGDADGCRTQDWADVDATDRIALVVRGGCTFGEKAQAAAQAGAVALIVRNNTAGAFVGALGGNPAEHLPTVGVTAETGRLLLDLPADASVSITIDKVVEERQTFSVLAEIGAAQGEDVAVIGAHLDGGDEGPGINDNGTGSAILLETARQLAGSQEASGAVRFAWWGASTLDNLGSRSYVSDLAAEDPDALGRISLYLDVDTVASPNHVLGVQDPDRAGSVLADHLDSLGQAWVRTTTPADSDTLAFIDHGVPAAGLTTGTTGKKSAREADLFGGTAGLSYDPNHGTVADDLDNVDLEVLRTTTAAVAHAAQELASRR